MHHHLDLAHVDRHSRTRAPYGTEYIADRLPPSPLARRAAAFLALLRRRL